MCIPRSWTCDPGRCWAVGLGATVFATRAELARTMIDRFPDAGHRVGWVTGDEVYGGHPPVSTGMFDHVLRRAGLTVQQVRQDRILFAARETPDALHLMRVFGISDGAAMRYITASHPERTTKTLR